MRRQLPNISFAKLFTVTRFYITILLLSAVCASHAQSPIVQFDVKQPRAFGYYLGDKFERTVNLTLANPYSLDEASLPKPGFLRPWLRVEKPTVVQTPTANGTNYQINFVYQIVNIDSEHLSIGVAHHNIQIDNQSETNPERFNILIPATRVSAALITTKPGEDLQADAKPTLANVNFSPAAAYAGLLAVSLIGIYLLTFGWSIRNTPRPFSRIHQRLKHQTSKDWNEEKYTEALKDTHAAFNQVAGHTIFQDDIGKFIAENPSFRDLKPKIDEFFLHTRHYFFAEAADNDAGMSTTDLIEFLGACSRAERHID